MPESDDPCHSVLLRIHVLTGVKITFLPEIENLHPRHLGEFRQSLNVGVVAFLQSFKTNISGGQSKLGLGLGPSVGFVEKRDHLCWCWHHAGVPCPVSL